jgi:hypothetical protein
MSKERKEEVNADLEVILSQNVAPTTSLIKGYC